MNSVTVGYGLAKAGRNKHLLVASFQKCEACGGSDNRRSCQAYSQRSTALSVLRSCNTIATSPNVPVVMSQRSLFTVLFINFSAIIPFVYRNTCGAQFLRIFHTILLIFKTGYWLYNVKHDNSTSML